MKSNTEPLCLTEPQFVSLQQLIENYYYANSYPKEIYYDSLCDCLMVIYSFITIGIEPDGYTHS